MTTHLLSFLLSSALIHLTLATIATDTCDVTQNSLVLNPNADVMIGGLVSLREPLNGEYGCGAVTSGLEHIEAIRWALERINEGKEEITVDGITQPYIPGVTIDIELYDSCHNVDTATHTIHMIIPSLSSTQAQCVTNNTQLFLGIISSDSSQISMETASLAGRADIPFLSIAASASGLSDSGEYPTHVRTVPSDLQIVQAMIKTLKAMHWQFITVVYTSDSIGRGRFDAFVNELENSEFCVALAVEVEAFSTNDDKYQDTLMQILRSDSNAVVYLGTSGVLARLFRAAESTPEAGRLQWVLPERVEFTPYAKGVVIVTPNIQEIPEFNDHWMGINDTFPLLEHPWYAQWYMTQLQCRLPGITEEPFVTFRDCDTLPPEQRHLSLEPEPVHSAIRAVFTYASALQNAHADLCLSAEGICHSLARLAGDELMERYLRPLGYDDSGDMVDLKMGVWNYKDRNGSFAFEQIGSFDDGQLTLNPDDIAHYNEEMNQTLSSHLTSLCHEDQCQICYKSPKTQPVSYFYKEGDIILGASLQIHLPGMGPYSCGDMDIHSGPQLAEAFLFALDKVNEDKILGDDITLGGFAFDNCYDFDLSANTISNFYGDASRFHGNNGSIIKPRYVPVFLGGRAAAAEYAILEKFDIPLIGFRSFDATLTEDAYPLFLSTTGSLLDLIKLYSLTLQYLGHKYVNVLIRPNGDAKETLQFFKSYLAEHAGICIEYIEQGYTKDDYVAILDKLSSRSTARALVVFGDDRLPIPLLQAITDLGLENTYHLVGFMGLVPGAPDRFLLNQAASNHSIVFKLYAGNNEIPELYDRLNGIDPFHSENPWFREWYEILNNCSLAVDSFEYSRRCSDNEPDITASPLFLPDTHLRPTINAVYTAAHGLRKTLEFYCGDNFTSVCPEFHDSSGRGQTLRDFMQQSEFTGLDGEVVKYHGNRIVTKMGIQQVIDGQYVEIGNYTTSSDDREAHIDIDAPKLISCTHKMSPPSVCTGPCHQCHYLHTPGRIMTKTGDVSIAGIFDIHHQGDSAFLCGDVDLNESYELYAAFQYAIDRINTGLGPVTLKNVTLGYTAIDSCNSELRTSTIISNLTSGESVRSLLGIVHGSKLMLDNIDSISEELDMPVVGGSLTKTTKSDTFFNTFTSAKSYTGAVVQLLKEMGWFYINVIIDDRAKSKNMFESLKDMAFGKNICILELFNTSIHTPEDIASSLVQSPTSISVVLSDNIAELTRALNDLGPSAENIHFIHINLEGENSLTDSIRPGFIQIQNKARADEDLIDYLEDITLANRMNDPWLIEYMQEAFQCDVAPSNRYGSYCDEDMSVIDGIIGMRSGATVNAVFALVAALDRVLKQTCGTDYNGICGAFYHIESIQDSILKVLPDVEFELKDGEMFSFNPMSKHFDHGLIAEFFDQGMDMVQFAEYSNGVLTMVADISNMYQNIKMDCSPFCDQCIAAQQTEERFSITEGDVIFAGIFDVHRKGNSAFSCGAINEDGGYQLLEAFNYAVHYVNSKRGIFANTLSGVTVGSLGIDSCQSAIRAGFLVSNIHSYKTPLATENSQINPSDIAVYIGALDSQTTIAVADVLSVLNIPQISYGASTILLKDMEKYPYFLRTVPADDKQARNMVALLRYFRFEYVQIVHSASAYGRGGVEAFTDLAHNRGICIAQVLSMSIDSIPAAVDSILESLLSKQNASVAIVFLDEHHIIPFLQAMDRNNEARNKFFLIGSETWANDNEVLSTVPNIARNSLTLGVEKADVRRFDQYLNDITDEAFSNEENTWFREYYETMQACTIDGSHVGAPSCFSPPRGLASSSNYKQDPYVLYVVNAVFAAALGLDSALKEVCGPNYKGLCSAYSSLSNKHDVLYSAIKAASFQDETRQRFEFDEQGESNRGYQMYIVNEIAATGDLYISDIGSYNDTHGLKLDSRVSIEWLSNCDAPESCIECSIRMTEQTRYAMTPGHASLAIMGFFDVHHSTESDALKCGDLNMQGDFANVLAFFYALDYLEERGVGGVGGLVVDTCSSTARVTQDLVSHLTLNGLCGAEGGVHPANILAYLSTGNDNTATVTQLVSGRGTVMISPNAGGSDFIHIPHFVSTVPSDDLHARALADIAREMGYVYVAVISSVDPNSMRAAEAFLEAAKSEGGISVCVGLKYVINHDASIGNVEDILRGISETQGMLVVVTFVNTKDTSSLLSALGNLSTSGDTAVRRLNFFGLNTPLIDPNLRGALTLRPRSVRLQRYIDYVTGLTLSEHGYIPDDWFEEFWQRANGCKLLSARKVVEEYRRECALGERISEDEVFYDASVFHTILATDVLVDALNRIPECMNNEHDQKECFKRLNDRNKELYDNIIQADLTYGRERFSFTEEGSGDILLDIYNLRQNGNQYSYHLIGNWSLADGLKLDRNGYQAYDAVGDIMDSFTSQCPKGDQCDCIANTGINGGNLGGYLPTSQQSFRKPLDSLEDYDNYNEAWGLVLTILSAVGIAITLLLFIYLMIYYPVKSGTSALGYFVLFGVLCLYALNFAFIWVPTDETCFIRRFCFGVIYALIFSCFLVKVLNTWRIGDAWDDYNPPTYERLSHPCSLVAITIGLMLVQVIIAIEWLVLQKAEVDFEDHYNTWYPRCEPYDSHNEEMVLSCIYVMFLILLTMIFSAVTWDSNENHRESRWILMTSLFTSIIWIAWICVTLLAGYKYRDPAYVIANLVNATVVLMFMYIRKIYLLNKYTKEIEDERKSQLSAGSRPPSNVGYYVNPAYSTVEAASVRSSEKTSPGVEGAPAYVFHRNAPGADVQY